MQEPPISGRIREPGVLASGESSLVAAIAAFAVVAVMSDPYVRCRLSTGRIPLSSTVSTRPAERPTPARVAAAVASYLTAGPPNSERIGELPSKSVPFENRRQQPIQAARPLTSDSRINPIHVGVKYFHVIVSGCHSSPYDTDTKTSKG
jgi:hypothetical protein